MYRYTSAPPSHHSHSYSHAYLYPPLYPHNLASRSYNATYMSRAYPYTEPRRYSSYYETTYSRPSTSYRTSQAEPWRYVRSAQTPPPDQTRRKSSLKKTASRHVHFDLPPAPGTSSRTIRIAEEERQRERERLRAREKDRAGARDRDRERERERDWNRDRERNQQREKSYEPPRPPIRHHDPASTMPKKHYTSYSHTYEYDSEIHHRERYRTSSPSPAQRTTLPRSNSYHTTTPSTSISIPHPTIPTVYIITFATDLTPNERSISALLSSQLPLRTPPIPHLYTIDARNVRPPSVSLCREYSGISRVIQDVVMQDSEARRAARRAVDGVLAFGEEERDRMGERGRGKASQGRAVEVSLSVCCHSGTHRSVAIAERIAQCVKSEVGRRGCADGVRVVCRHVHRVKGRRDPF
jgi:hypothetical protein